MNPDEAPSPSPLLVTVEIDDDARQWFDALRRAHFPGERLVVGAHLTLFHALPGRQRDRITADLAAVTGRAPSRMRVVGVRRLRRGVAYELDAPEVARVRQRLARDWGELLGEQDRRPFHPHVTVQNKVAPEVARALHARLQAQFVPFEVTAEGLALWRYRGGPWELERRYPFATSPPG